MYNNLMLDDPHALPSDFQPGDRVATDCGAYKHVGTVSERRWIYANSRKYGHLCEVPPYAFSGGRPIKNEGFLGIRTRHQVLDHLRTRLGTPYQLTEYNCEHSNNEAHGLGRWSPQMDNLALAIFAFGIGAVCIAAVRK